MFTRIIFVLLIGLLTLTGCASTKQPPPAPVDPKVFEETYPPPILEEDWWHVGTLNDGTRLYISENKTNYNIFLDVLTTELLFDHRDVKGKTPPFIKHEISATCILQSSVDLSVISYDNDMKQLEISIISPSLATKRFDEIPYMYGICNIGAAYIK